MRLSLKLFGPKQAYQVLPAVGPAIFNRQVCQQEGAPY